MEKLVLQIKIEIDSSKLEKGLREICELDIGEFIGIKILEKEYDTDYFNG